MRKRITTKFLPVSKVRGIPSVTKQFTGTVAGLLQHHKQLSTADFGPMENVRGDNKHI